MRFALALAVLVAAPGTLPAQVTVSFQAGAMTGEYDKAFEAGIRVSPSPTDGFGLAFSFDVIPQFLSDGAVVGLTDLSVAGNIGLGSEARLELRAGGSALLGLGGGGAAALGGYNLGAGVVFSPKGPVGLRADYTYRRLQVDGGSYPLPSLTFGLVLTR